MDHLTLGVQSRTETGQNDDIDPTRGAGSSREDLGI